MAVDSLADALSDFLIEDEGGDARAHWRNLPVNL